MDAAALERTARGIVSGGRGVLAADESPGTAGKRLAAIGLANTPETRREFRRVLFAAAPRLAAHVGGVILHEESVGQVCADGARLVQPLVDAGIALGIKLDAGTHPLLGGGAGETATAGLDGLLERAQRFREMGCTFAKWRCTYRIGDSTPSQLAIEVNADILARYAAACQASGLVPIVEPEVLMDGDHGAGAAALAGRKVLAAVFARLHAHGVHLPGILLKPSFVVSGASCPSGPAPADVVGRLTAELLASTVPPAVPGVCFLSGGLSESAATACLAAANQAASSCLWGRAAPWRLTFSFARALQNSAVAAWAGRAENEAAAADVLVLRARLNSEASLGKSPLESSPAADASLHVAGYTY